MKRTICAAAFLAIAAVLLMGAQPVYSQSPTARQGYSITDLGTLGGGYSEARGINNRGQVVGGGDTASGGNRAFLWEDGEMTDLGTLAGGGQSYAVGINSRGQVVGSGGTASGENHPILWTK